MNRTLRAGFAAAAVGYLVAMTVTGALPVHRQRIPFEARGVLPNAPDEIVRVDLVRGDAQIMLVRAADIGWQRAGARNEPLAAPLAEKLSLAVQFMHTSAPIRALEPGGLPHQREFGLEQPALSVALHASQGPVLRAHFGGPSPVGMLQYMAVDQRPGVFLMSRFVGEQWRAVAEALFQP